MGRVRVDHDVSLYVEEYGSGSHVVFVHAGGMTHAAWDHQVSAMMERFHVVSYDMRGVGASDRPATGYSIDQHAADLLSLVEQLELGSATIVGHGIGAHVSLRFAAQHPDSVEGLVLVSGAPWAVGDRGQEGGLSDVLWTAMKSGLMTDRGQADLDLIDGQYFHRKPSEGMRLWCREMASAWPLPVLKTLMADLATVDHRDALSQIGMPVLILHGRHDRKNRYEGGVYLAEQLPHARLVTFEESAVCPQLEEVDLFNESLSEFVTSVAVPLDAHGERSRVAAAQQDSTTLGGVPRRGAQSAR